MQCNNSMIDLAHKYAEEKDIFDMDKEASFENNVRDVQESFNANYNKFYSERQKDYVPKSKFEAFACDEDIFQKKANVLEKSLDQFKSEEYKLSEAKVKVKERIESLEDLFESSKKESSLEVNVDAIKPKSLQSRFLQSLREKSVKIQKLEESIARTNLT